MKNHRYGNSYERLLIQLIYKGNALNIQINHCILFSSTCKMSVCEFSEQPYYGNLFQPNVACNLWAPAFIQTGQRCRCCCFGYSTYSTRLALSTAGEKGYGNGDFAAVAHPFGYEQITIYPAMLLPSSNVCSLRSLHSTAAILYLCAYCFCYCQSNIRRLLSSWYKAVNRIIVRPVGLHI